MYGDKKKNYVVDRKPGVLLIIFTGLVVGLNAFTSIAVSGKETSNLESILTGFVVRVLLIPLVVMGLFQIGRGFRNTRSRVKIILWVSVLMVLSNIGLLWNARQHMSVGERLQKVAAAVSTKLPKPLDNGVTWTSAIAKGDALVFTYVLANETATGVDVSQIKVDEIVQAVCHSSKTFLLDQGATLELQYQAKDGTTIKHLRIQQQDCMKAAPP